MLLFAIPGTAKSRVLRSSVCISLSELPKESITRANVKRTSEVSCSKEKAAAAVRSKAAITESSQLGLLRRVTIDN